MASAIGRRFVAASVFACGFAAGARGASIDGVWTRLDRMPPAVEAGAPWVRPERFVALSVDLDALDAALESAPLEDTPDALSRPLLFALPMPDGEFEWFEVVESPVLAPELQAEFPQIRTYLGRGVDDRSATARLDRTPQGFHAQVLSPRGAVYVDPYTRGDVTHYAVYFKRDARPPRRFPCLVSDEETGPILEPARETPSLLGASVARRHYRLAVAATAEYTASVSADANNPTVLEGQAAVATAVNRVNQIYENDLAIRLIVVAGNSALVFTNAATDGYTNGNVDAMLGQNQSKIDAVIGNANYDVGHVFGTNSGGKAFLGVVCTSGSKALGVSASGVSTGDPFWIDYVCHEIGHQFNAPHTFNNCGDNSQRTGNAAYEPGSASTIMGYAGICGADDLQPNSDPYFHWHSIATIETFVASGGGSSCATVFTTANRPPTVSSLTTRTIPMGTPFSLVASGSDPDGDPITFCIEESDLGPAQPAVGPGSDDNGRSPLFRSFRPTSDPARTLPRLADLLSGSTTIGEQLPATSRSLVFAITARDNVAGAGGTATASAAIDVTSAAGPFRITSPNSHVTWSGIRRVTWDVAGTDAAPVNCANVIIQLSTDGGGIFTNLMANVANDGEQDVVLPSITTTRARLRIRAQGNVFFDVTDTDFTIVPSTSNDRCVNAEPVFDGSIRTGTLTGATNDGGSSCGTSTGNPDVWYSFVAPCNGTLRVTSCGTNDAPGVDAGLDTVISIHSSCPGTAANELVCSDDAPPGACTGDSGARRDAVAEVPLVTARGVFIRVTNHGLGFFDPAFRIEVTFIESGNRPTIQPVSNHHAECGRPYARTLYLTSPSCMNPVTWSLVSAPAGMGIGASGGRIDWASPVIGNFNVVARATNSAGFDEESWTLSVDRMPPTIVAIPDATVACAAYVGPTPSVTNLPCMGPVTWSLVDRPSGMTINASTGVVTWTSPVPGSHAVRIRATNTSGFDDEAWTLTVSGIAPVIVDVADATTCLSSYGGPAPQLAGGACALPVTWTLVSGPGGMTIDAATGVVSWPSPFAGSRTVTIRATNAFGSDDESWLLSTGSAAFPVLNDIPDATIACGSGAYVGPAPTLTNPSCMSPVTYSLITRPAGMTIDSVSGVVTWPTPIVGLHAIDVRATNAVGSIDEAWTLRVDSLAPVVSAIPDQTTFCGLGAYLGPIPSLTNSACMSPVTWSLVVGPPALSITAAGDVRWPMADVVVGDHLVVIRAQNDAGADDEAFVLHVPRSAPDVNEIADAIVPVPGGAYVGPVPTLFDSGPCTGPVSWSLVAGPSGLSIDPWSGVVTWPITAPGSHEVTIRARNSAGFDDESWIVTVGPAPATSLCEIARLVPSDGAANAGFGGSVALSGSVAVVGAPYDDEAASDAGAAYVFERSGSAWMPVVKLRATDAASGDAFGQSVAVEGDTIAVCACGTDGFVGGNSGSVYVFVRSGSSWVQQTRLVDNVYGGPDEFLGWSVSMSGDTIVAGAFNAAGQGVPNRGAADVFVRSGGSWFLQARLLALDGEAFDYFGRSVAIDGDTAVVGAQLVEDSVAEADAGAAYVFVRSNGTWTQQARLRAADRSASDLFGVSVALSGEVAIVGAFGDDDLGNGSGSVYAFSRSGSNWTDDGKRTASNGAASDGFGFAVALEGNTAFVGSNVVFDPVGDGSVYVLARGASGFTEQAELRASDASPSGAFGVALSSDDASLLVGANGAAYVFTAGGASCASCGDGSVASSVGAPIPVLLVNGTAGTTPPRTVSVSLHAPITVTLEASPAGPATDAAYVVWAWHGAPTSPSRLVAFGTDVGCTVNPTPVRPSALPQPFACLRGSRVPMSACRSLPGPTSAPWSRTRAGGFSVPITLTIQGVLEDAGASNALGYSTTNAVTIVVQ
ncbi:MAG: putative Ig domain-containing protein [Planctomycetes bacterium]|nr:putative Ig domain-containing protein [Planctomycetota bacterium]